MALPPIRQKARDYFAQATKAGNMQAANELGLIYYQGNGVEQNAEEAVTHIRKAAEAGLAQAQYNLGLLYANGHGVDKDVSTAGDWYQKAHCRACRKQHSTMACWSMPATAAFARMSRSAHSGCRSLPMPATRKPSSSSPACWRQAGA
jgi:TPR repeat protein